MTDADQTVFVVDDDRSFLAGVSRLLRASGFTVEAFDSPERFLAQLAPEARGCVLTDLRMPGMTGQDLQNVLASSGDPLPIVFLTGHGNIPASVEAMRHGAEDFLTKAAPKEDLLAALGRALERDRLEKAERERQGELVGRFTRLTPRESEVLMHVLSGRLNKQIASALDVNERSVKRHRTSLMHKLEVQSVAELARLAAEAGISPETSQSDLALGPKETRPDDGPVPKGTLARGAAFALG